MSKRKPCNDFAGYVCSVKSKHPDLPGYFWVCDRDNGGAWLIGEDDNRWAVCYEPRDTDKGPTLVTLGSQRSARDLMKDVANGSNVADFGQNGKG